MSWRNKGFVDEHGVHHNDPRPIERKKRRIAFIIGQHSDLLNARGEPYEQERHRRLSRQELMDQDWIAAGTFIGRPRDVDVLKGENRRMRRGELPARYREE